MSGMTEQANLKNHKIILRSLVLFRFFFFLMCKGACLQVY